MKQRPELNGFVERVHRLVTGASRRAEAPAGAGSGLCWQAGSGEGRS